MFYLFSRCGSLSNALHAVASNWLLSVSVLGNGYRYAAETLTNLVLLSNNVFRSPFELHVPEASVFRVPCCFLLVCQACHETLKCRYKTYKMVHTCHWHGPSAKGILYFYCLFERGGTILLGKFGKRLVECFYLCPQLCWRLAGVPSNGPWST